MSILQVKDLVMTHLSLKISIVSSLFINFSPHSSLFTSKAFIIMTKPSTVLIAFFENIRKTLNFLMSCSIVIVRDYLVFSSIHRSIVL